MNPTTQAIIANLHKSCPGAGLVTPREIAAAYGLNTPNAIMADIRTGRLPANCIHNRAFISMAAAERYIIENEHIPDEGTWT